MAPQSSSVSIRRRLLNAAFRLLYGPLVLLHEPAGRVLFGRAWDARRIMTLGLVDRTGTILDVGCGDGRLLRWGTKRGLNMIGVEPSKRMRERAGHDTRVLSGCAQALPVAADSIQAIVITYPGGWIRDPATWSEVDRVLVDGGDIAVLLGGTYERGFLSGIRKRAIHLVYGNGTRYELIGDTLPESPQLIIRWLDDRWGSFAVIQSTERDGQ